MPFVPSFVSDVGLAVLVQCSGGVSESGRNGNAKNTSMNMDDRSRQSRATEAHKQ